MFKASSIAGGRESSSLSICGSPAKAENLATAITTSRAMMPLQMRSDLKLAFSSRKKMFILRLLRNRLDVAAKIQPITQPHCHHGDRNVEQQQRAVERAVLDD